MRPAKLYVGSSSSGCFLAARYRWEFLRRSSKYRADYQLFLASFQKWFSRHGYWYDDERRRSWSKSTRLSFQKEIAPSLSRLCVKYDVFDLFSPECGCDEDFDEMGTTSRRFILPTGGVPASSLDYRSPQRAPVPIDAAWENGPALLRGNLLTVRFNLQWPMKDLEEYASGILRLALSDYHRQLSDQGIKSRAGRRRFGDFDLHLKAWDFSKAGMKNREIAKALFPQLSPNIGQRKVRDHLRSAERLILGHYKEIR